MSYQDIILERIKEGDRATMERDTLIRENKQLRIEQEDLLNLLQDALSYITPTISTHEEIVDLLNDKKGFWCPCGYCPKPERP
jgi:hypothetical protein